MRYLLLLLLCHLPFVLRAQVYENTEYGFSLHYASPVWQPLPPTGSSGVLKVAKSSPGLFKLVASRKSTPEAEVTAVVNPVPAAESNLTVSQVREGYLTTLQKNFGNFDYTILSTTPHHIGPYEGTIFNCYFKLPFNSRTHAITLVIRRENTFYSISYLAREDADDTFRVAGIDVLTSLTFPGADQPASTGALPAMSTVFGSSTLLPDGLVGKIYALPETTAQLPNFDELQPFGELHTREINIPARDWTEGFPGIPGAKPRVEWFGIEYQGLIKPYAPGVYEFRLVSDDGAKLFIDDKLVINNDGIHRVSSASGQVTLNASTHSFKLQYFQGPRYAIALQLFVKAQNRSEAVFPDVLFLLRPPLPPAPRAPQALWQGRILDDSTRQPLPRAQLLPTTPSAAVAVDARAAFAWSTAPGLAYAYEVRQPGYYVAHGTWQAVAPGRQQDILLRKIRVGSTVRLENVQFQQGKSVMLPGAETSLRKLLDLLNEHPTMTIELAGHTDNVGNAEKNVQLSESRVAVVKAYLIEHGITASRIVGRGYGGSRPRASNEQEQTRRLNRRVEFTITGLE